MARLLLLFLLVAAAPAVAGEVTFTGDCSDGCAAGESFPASNMNEIKTEVDDNDSRLDAVLSTDTCTTPPCDLESGTTVGGASVQTGTDDDVPESGDFGAAADLEADGSISDGAVDASAIAAGGITAADAAADMATQAKLDAKSAATSTDNALPRFDGTSGDLQDGSTTEDDSGNVTIDGTLSVGAGDGATCLIFRDSDDAGDSACEVLDGTFSCETDTNGVCGDAT